MWDLIMGDFQTPIPRNTTKYPGFITYMISGNTVSFPAEVIFYPVLIYETLAD